VQEKKIELYQAIVKLEQDGKGDATLQVHFNITRFVHPSWQIVINFCISFIIWI